MSERHTNTVKKSNSTGEKRVIKMAVKKGKFTNTTIKKAIRRVAAKRAVK